MPRRPRRPCDFKSLPRRGRFELVPAGNRRQVVSSRSPRGGRFPILPLDPPLPPISSRSPCRERFGNPNVETVAIRISSRSPVRRRFHSLGSIGGPSRDFKSLPPQGEIRQNKQNRYFYRTIFHADLCNLYKTSFIERFAISEINGNQPISRCEPPWARMRA